MKAKDFETWLAALRGEITDSNDEPYEQATNYLMDAQGRMCCLGVAEDQILDGTWEQEAPGMAYVCRLNGEHAGRHMPTDEAYTLMGLPRVIANRAAKMNDRGDSFRRIAAWLERRRESIINFSNPNCT